MCVRLLVSVVKVVYVTTGDTEKDLCGISIKCMSLLVSKIV